MATDQNIGTPYNASAIRVKGPDSARFLNGMLTQDVQKLGASGRGFLLTPKGKIISPLYFVSLGPDEYCLWTQTENFEALWNGLNKYLIADRVELRAEANLKAWSLVHSDYAFSALANRTKFGLEKLFLAERTEDFYVVPQGLLSPTHVEILCLHAHVRFVELSSLELNQKYFAARTPQWNVDYFPDDFFLEFPLADSVSFDKGCYVGQETVARGTFRGKVNKSYAHFSSDKNLSPGEILNLAGEKLGTLRSVLAKQGTGLAKFDLGERNAFLINGEEHKLNVTHLVNEETFRKGR